MFTNSPYNDIKTRCVNIGEQQKRDGRNRHPLLLGYSTFKEIFFILYRICDTSNDNRQTTRLLSLTGRLTLTQLANFNL